MLTRLQILRALAAYLVVAYHCGEMLTGNAGIIVPANHLGAAGVDLFFVISGFVMVHIAGQRDGPGRFMFDRVARIAPLYWAATFAAIGAVAVRPWLFQNAIVTPDTIAASLLFVPALDAAVTLSPILFVGWTLNWEMMFYSLFALSMFAPMAWRLPVLGALLIAVFVGGSLAPDTSALSFYGSPILFEFAAGGAVGWLVRDPGRLAQLRRFPMWLFIAGGAVLFAASVAAPDALDERLLKWGIPASLIVLGIVVLDLTRPIAKGGLLASLGDASYSAYLIHVFVVQAVALAVLPLVGTSALGIAAVYVSVFTGTAVISAATYRWIEIPSRDALRRLLPSAAKANREARSPR